MPAIKKKPAAKPAAAAKPTSKLAALRAAWAAGDHRTALKLAAAFPRLGKQKDVITAAHAAAANPRTYREMNKDPDALYAAGLAAVADKYGLPPAEDATAKKKPAGKPAAAAKPKAGPVPSAPRPHGVRACPSRPYLAGTIVRRHGLAAGVTPQMIKELDAAYGRPNPRESQFCLKNAWHAVRAYAGAAPDAATP